MELIVFDLDGTLLNGKQRISAYTMETLTLLAERNIAYTVATGRTLHAALPCFAGHRFPLPQIYKNGVVIWNPQSQSFSHRNCLTRTEVEEVLEAFVESSLTPFVMTIDDQNQQSVYHGPLQSDFDHAFFVELKDRTHRHVFPLQELPEDGITNISTSGKGELTEKVITQLKNMPHLTAYYGEDMYTPGHFWMDVHHCNASKGGAIQLLKQEHGFERVICFGDGENDVSMFEVADEAYAPANAADNIKAMATEVIGHHDEDGIAKFLRKRFNL